MTPTPQGSQVPGNDEELISFLQQTVREEISKQAKTPGSEQQVPTQAPATTIPVNINGQTFNFNNPQELSTAVQGLVNNYNQQLVDAKSAPAVKTNEVAGNDEVAFDINKFVEKMTTNPVDAFDYVDEHRFGMKNPAKAIKDAIGSVKEVGDLKKVLGIYQFRDTHPEVAGNPQAAQVISQIVQAQGLSQDAQGLEYAYGQAVLRGLLPHPSAFRQQQEQARQTQQYSPAQQEQQYPYGSTGGNSPFAPPPPQTSQYPFGAASDPRFYNGGINPNFAPPRVGRGASDPVPNLAEMAEDLTADQIANVFRKLQG